LVSQKKGRGEAGKYSIHRQRDFQRGAAKSGMFPIGGIGECGRRKVDRGKR